MNPHPTTAEHRDQPPTTPDSEVTVQFLRHLPRFGSATDSHANNIIRRVGADILELIIRAKRRRSGVARG